MKEMKNYQVPEIKVAHIPQHVMNTTSVVPGEEPGSIHAEFSDEGIDFEKGKQ